ncbi:MAG: hypothetical protein ACXAE3_09700 [Candidatus Kariarchaeaceae archaeon]|jgi:hypothetical protein
MLQELFVLRDGQPLLYYSAEEQNDADFDRTMLSSGILSAMSAFSEEARDAQMDNFASDTELFQFSKSEKLDVIIVGAFPRETPPSLARVMVEYIQNKLEHVEILEMEGMYDLLRLEKMKFVREIPEFVAQIMLHDIEESYFDNIVKDCPGVNLGVLIALETKKQRWLLARPRPLFYDGMVQDLLLTDQFAGNLTRKTGLSQHYNLIVISAGDLRMVIGKTPRQVVLIQSSIADIPRLVATAARMCFQVIYPKVFSGEVISQYGLTKTDLTLMEGKDELGKRDGVFFQTLINSVSKIFQQTMNRAPSEILLFYERNKFIRASRQDSGMVIVKLEHLNPQD